MSLPTAPVQPVLAKKDLRVRLDSTREAQCNAKPKIVKATRAVVIDIRTGYCKVGYAGQQKPSFVVSSTIGKHIQETTKTGDNRKETFVGREKEIANLPLKCVNPLRHGIIVDWECIEAIWEYIFVKEMKIQPEEHAVLVSDPPMSPATNREKYAEMIFETFNAPAFHIAYQSTLAMYSYGKTTSLIVECGHGVSYVVPIREGHVLHNITDRSDYVGADITKYLMELLNEAGNEFEEEHLDIIEDIKNKCCYITTDVDLEMYLPPNEYVAEYELPDGQLITIGQERFICPEALFKPSMIGSTQPGLQTMTMNCINNCDASYKKTMLNNILLCGGMTMLEGFPERFQKELNKLSSPEKPFVFASPERKCSVWTGGSILASLKSFQQLWVHRKEYEEHGPSIIYTKCF